MRDDLILLTGITGFIAKRIALDLLLAGYRIRGTLRSDKGMAEVRDALRPHLPDPAILDRLSFAKADLTSDTGWAAAMEGVSAVIHTASPFPIAQPRDPETVIRPAVDGTLRVLRAAQAAGVTRVVLTSSMEAVMHGGSGRTVSSADWTDLSAPTVSAYTQSKTLAERAAWDFVAAHPEMRLTAINPGMVLGTPVDANTGSSVSVVQRFLKGRDPAVPNVMLPVVDVADVSAMHVGALDRPVTIGQRYVCADRFMSFPEMADALRAAYPGRRIPRRIAPKALLRLLALFDKEIRLVVPWVGWTVALDNSAAQRDFGMNFVPARDAVLRTAAFLDGQV
jgi:dihydroflavonol-4-reductase